MRFILGLLLALSIGLLQSCGGSSDENIPLSLAGADKNRLEGVTDPQLIEIIQLEDEAAKDTVLNRTRGSRLLRAYQEYYNKHPKDTVGLNYLFEAANLAQKLDKHQRAIDLFINFYEGFPKSHRADEAVFNIAYIYDARMDDKVSAKKYYQKVIELYPSSMWAEEARKALNILDKSDEELLQFLKDQNPGV